MMQILPEFSDFIIDVVRGNIWMSGDDWIMNRFWKFMSRGIILWFLALVLTALTDVHYMEWVVIGGALILMGSYLIFAVLWVFVFYKKGVRPNAADPIPAETKIRVNGQMTGNTRFISSIPHGGRHVEYTEYEMEYTVQGQKYTNWFHMYPGPDLGDVYEKGTLVRLVCDLEKPNHFEVLGVGEE